MVVKSASSVLASCGERKHKTLLVLERHFKHDPKRFCFGKMYLTAMGALAKSMLLQDDVGRAIDGMTVCC